MKSILTFSDKQEKNSAQICEDKSLEQIGKLVFSGELKVLSSALHEFNKQLRIGWQNKLPGFPGKRGAYVIAGYNYLLWYFHERKKRTFEGSAGKLANVARKYLGANVTRRQIVRARQKAAKLPLAFSVCWSSGVWKPTATAYRGTRIRNILATSRRDLILFGALNAMTQQESEKATFEKKNWRGVSGIFNIANFWKLRHSWSDNNSDWRAGINASKLAETILAAKAIAHNYKRQPGDKKGSAKRRDALGEQRAREFAAQNARLSPSVSKAPSIEEELVELDKAFRGTESRTNCTAKNSQITALEVFNGQPENMLEAVRSDSVSGTQFESFSYEVKELKDLVEQHPEELIRQDLERAISKYLLPREAPQALQKVKQLLMVA